MSNIDAQLTTIAVGDAASPEVFTTIIQVTAIDGPDGSATEIDASNLSSTAKEFKVGLKDEGQVTLSINYDPDNAQHEILRAALGGTASKNYVITMSDGSPATTFSFAAFVMAFTPSYAVDGIVTASVTLRITGAVVKA